MLHRLAVRSLVLAVLFVAVLLFRPVHDGIQRWGFLAGAVAIWAAGLVLSSRKKGLMAALALLPVVAAAPFLLPGRPLDVARLRASYLAGMRECEGVRYVWGGESLSGIDCSGLPRRAWRRALLEQAWQGNGAAFRAWAEQWWYDTSARAIGEGYRHFTVRLTGGRPMNDLVSTVLQPGDLAVTEDGRHVMAYLDDGEWIQADPSVGRVFRFYPGDQNNPWRLAPVELCRWSLLERAATEQ